MSDIVFIYTLSDPDTGKVRYVGQTISTRARISNHVSDCQGDGKKQQWIRSLVETGKEPVMTAICSIPAEYADQVETALIQAYKLAFPDLLNVGVAPRGGVVARQKAKARQAPDPVVRNAIKGIVRPDGSIMWPKSR